MLWQSTVEGENEVWPDCHPSDDDLSLGSPDFHPSDEHLSLGTPDFHPSDEDLSLGTPDFRRNPKGRGHFSSFLRRLSLAYPGMPRSSLLELREKWLPSLSCQYMSMQSDPAGSPSRIPLPPREPVH
jgi:hypothetical protein